MGKRANAKTATTVQPAKKAKTDPGLAAVVDAIMAADQIPSQCRTMLVAMLPYSLQEMADKRHSIQEMAVGMMDETFNGTKSGLEAGVAAEDAKLAELKGSETELGKKVSESEGALSDQKQKAEAAKSALAEATTAERESSKALTDRKKEQKEGADKLGLAEKEKAELETAFEAHFKPIEEGAAGPHFKQLEKHLKKIEIEASLLTALPSSCTKTKESRGTFDHVVIEEFKKALTEKIAALGSELAAAGPVSAERAAAVEAAVAAQETAKAAQIKAAAELEAAQKEQKEREAALAKARLAVKQFQPEVEAVTARASEAKKALEDFVAGPLATFLTFKTKVTPAPEVVAEVAPQAEPEVVADVAEPVAEPAA